jgi:hypothetical protein
MLVLSVHEARYETAGAAFEQSGTAGSNSFTTTINLSNSCVLTGHGVLLLNSSEGALLAHQYAV